MDTSSDSDSVVHELPTSQAVEGELSDLDQDVSVTDNDQTLTEEQNFIHGLDTYTGH